MKRSFVNWGVQDTDSVAKVRAKNIGNIIGASAVLNCLIFGVLVYFLKDWEIMRACVYAALIYSVPLLMNGIGFSNIGRPFNLIAGNLVVFWFACYFQGKSEIQLFFYSLSIMPFMYFAWEERANYLLSLLSVFLIVLGESHSYRFFTPHQQHYDMTFLTMYSMLAPLSQIFGSVFYFLKQSVKFEKESNENLEKLEVGYQKQIQVQKMSSLGEMAAGIAHEINNPLMVIIGTVHNLKKTYEGKFPGTDPFFIKADKIEATAARIGKIIHALRIFSRNAENDPTEVVPVEQIVDDTLALCRERFLNAGIKLQVETTPGLEVPCRSSEISQVLLNLLNNAFDATQGRENSVVRITTAIFSDTQVEILIEDNGSGIRPDIADRIMEPFFTTKDVGKGTGLGLSVSKGIIESHHGKLALIPNTGKTTFQVLLPRSI